jgi:hypothetical protein
MKSNKRRKRLHKKRSERDLRALRRGDFPSVAGRHRWFKAFGIEEERGAFRHFDELTAYANKLIDVFTAADAG